MRRIPSSVALLAAGILVGAVSPGAGAGAEAAVKNGDIDGNGAMEITDAIVLLQHLFQGGPPPVDCTCGVEPKDVARMRFANDLICVDAPVTATLDVCGSTMSQLTGGWGGCVEIPVAATCIVKVEVMSECGNLCMSSVIPIEKDHIYSFLITADAFGPFAVWFDQAADCAQAPPDVGFPVSGQLGDCPLGGEDSPAPGDFSSLIGCWSRDG
jgi:hypothetical protein